MSLESNIQALTAAITALTAALQAAQHAATAAPAPAPAPAPVAAALQAAQHAAPAMPAVPFPAAGVPQFGAAPAAPVFAPPPTPVAEAPAAPVARPFQDVQGACTWVVERFKALGPRGVEVQKVLAEMGLQNLSAVQPHQFDELFTKVSALG